MTRPTQTNCIEISTPGGPEVLIPATRELPELTAAQVLIEVSFAGVNRPDVVQREGNYAPPPGASDIPGLEVMGKIVETGKGVSGWKIGDSLCALLPGGGYARYAITEADHCLPIPSTLDPEQAAGLPETFFTVWYNLVEKGELQSGDTVLIHGGSSGIGTTAIQVACAWGATVYTTAGNDEKCRRCEELGATRAFNYKTEDFTQLKELTDGKGVDIILDMVGGDYVQKNIGIAATRGRIVNIAFLQGAKVTVNLMRMMLKQLVLTGSTLRSQPNGEKARIAAGVEKDFLPLVKAGKLAPVIHRTFPLEEASKAHQLMESSEHIGKIILDCRD